MLVSKDERSRLSVEAGKDRVLFLSRSNSVRSQMAEALLRHYADDRFKASSAGLDPAEVHPFTLRVLQEIGIDIAALHPKDVSEFLGKTRVRYAVILCENDEPDSPRLYPFALRTFHWPFEDPIQTERSGEEQLDKFRTVRDQIDEQIRAWLDGNDRGASGWFHDRVNHFEMPARTAFSRQSEVRK